MSASFFLLPAKTQIASFSEAAKMLLQQYDLGDLEIACILFEFNATFSVATQTGSKYALRINVNSTRTPENMRAEAAWVSHLQGHEAVNVATPIANSAGQYITTLHHADSNRTIAAILYSWLAGEDIRDEPTLEQLQAFGTTMARMHQAAATFTLPIGAQLPCFNDLLWGTEDFLFGHKSPLSESDRLLMDRARIRIMEDTDALYARLPTQVIHADLHGGNLKWQDNRLSVLDFDDCGMGVAPQDIAIALFYLDSKEEEQALLSGYQSVCALPNYCYQEMQSLLIQRRFMLLNYLFETNNQKHRAIADSYLVKTREAVSAYLVDSPG